MLNSSFPNALTVDVEDYFQVSAFEHRITREDWPRLESRVEANTQRLLRLFDAVSVRGTFFVLGWVADRFPSLVRSIHAAGHELASHGYWHRLIYDLTPDEFRQDLRASREAIYNACGFHVTAYRAPSFSIVDRSLWAIDTLLAEGFEFDSSIFPIRHDRYGIPNARSEIHEIRREKTLPATDCGTSQSNTCSQRKLETQSNSNQDIRSNAESARSSCIQCCSLIEFPPSVCVRHGLKMPIGGGYFRLFPLWLTLAIIKGIRSEGRPAMFYIHPWELDPQQPRVPNVGWKSCARHYVGLGSTEGKLRRLLTQVPFDTMGNVIQALRSSDHGPLT